MARLPGFELPGKVLPACIPQLGDDARVVCEKPVMQLVQRFDAV